MLDFIVSSDLAVVTLKNVLSFLIGQIVESKTEVVLDSNKHHETFVRTVQNKQYFRRNTTVLVGLAADPSEYPTSAGNLADNVASLRISQLYTGTVLLRTTVLDQHLNSFYYCFVLRFQSKRSSITESYTDLKSSFIK